MFPYFFGDKQFELPFLLFCLWFCAQEPQSHTVVKDGIEHIEKVQLLFHAVDHSTFARTASQKEKMTKLKESDALGGRSDSL